VGPTSNKGRKGGVRQNVSVNSKETKHGRPDHISAKQDDEQAKEEKWKNLKRKVEQVRKQALGQRRALRIGRHKKTMKNAPQIVRLLE